MQNNQNGQGSMPVAGEVIGSFASGSLEYMVSRARDAFLNSIASIQDASDPKPYLITLYGISLISNPDIRDSVTATFQGDMDNLEDEFSIDGIRYCIAVWAAISEYMSVVAGTGKREVVSGNVDTLPTDGMRSKKKKKNVSNEHVESNDDLIMDEIIGDV